MKRNTKTSTQKFGDGVRKIADKVKGARKKSQIGMCQIPFI